MKLTIKQKIAFRLECLIESTGELIHTKFLALALRVGRSVPNEYWESLVCSEDEELICHDCFEGITHGK